MSAIIKMNVEEQQQICRLCLKVANAQFEIDEIMKHLFEILFLKLDLDITRDPIVCQDCMEVAKKCLNFKSTCNDTEEVLLSYSADRKNVKQGIKVFNEEGECVQIVFVEDICRFCMTPLEKNNFVSLDLLMNGSMFMMLSEYMAEMDFNTIENPIVCANCKENLDGYLKFVLTCLDVEEKIKAYCKEKGTDKMGQVKLSSVLLFMDTDILEYPDKCSQARKIQQEHTKCINTGLCTELIKQEELDIEDEEMRTELDVVCLKIRQPYANTYQKTGQGNVMEKSSIDEGVPEVKRNEISDMEVNNAVSCTDGTKQTKTVKGDLIINSGSSDAGRQNYTPCTSEVKQQHVLRSHIKACEGVQPKQKMLIQKDVSRFQSSRISPMYKCALCTYAAKRKSSLITHMLAHKKSSEIIMHKCSFCAYEGICKSNLKKHMLVHKKVSEIKMHKCSFCAYETKRKYNLNAHMLVHKNVSEAKMYKCSLCNFKSKHKTSFRTHIFVHQNADEIKMYKCALCPFKSNQKCNLAKHVLIHKDVSELKMYKCSLCAYETKTKYSLNTHMLVHKNFCETEMYKCALCDYQTKYKNCLKLHILVHKDGSEINMHKCSFCSYESKRKYCLKTHILVHKSVYETKMYKCALCDYETKRKQFLKRHELVHKDVSEIKMHRCRFCSFETKRKSYLKTHVLVHKNASEIETYKCALCAFESKQKSNLKVHMVRHHRKMSEIKMQK